MRFAAVTSLLLLSGSTALGAILVQNGNTCTVSPGGSTPAPDKITKRALDEKDLEQGRAPPAPSETSLHAPGTPGSLERFPRPEPGSNEARHYDKIKAAERPYAPLPVPEIQQPELSAPDSVEAENVERDEVHDVEARQARPDDTPVFLDAFKRCGKDSKIIFTEGTYNIRQVMNMSLQNVDIDILGKFVWSADNIQYWLSRSMSVTYAGRSTAWMLTGNNISMRGYGKALFDGNGQTWIDQNRGGSNQNGRPISLTVWRAKNVYIDGITWRMSQFWHTFVAYSQNVTMTNLDMSTYSSSVQSSWNVNTDGIDTWNSKDIVISNWTVKCGDDCISVKGNTTNFHASNVVCQESGCACIGSMGSNAGQPDFVDNVVFKNFTCRHSSNAAWIKTYSGTGHVKNVTFEDFTVEAVDQPIYVTPCIYSGNGCDTSRIPITDVTWRNIKGEARYNVAVGIHCSAASPCDNFKFENIDIKAAGGGQAKILCSNIRNQATSGLNCTGTCPANWPQQLRGNRR